MLCLHNAHQPLLALANILSLEASQAPETFTIIVPPCQPLVIILVFLEVSLFDLSIQGSARLAVQL